jgi:predicted nucleic acid-binding Zn ribbon protein
VKYRNLGLSASKPKRLVSAQELLAGILTRKGYDPVHYALFDLWDRLLGNEAQNARAVGVRDGRLYIEVDTPVRTHGLALRKRELLKKMNAPFGGRPPLSDIIFRPGTPADSDDKRRS